MTRAFDGRPVIGVTLGHPDPATAEHWLSGLRPAPVLACTHLVPGRLPHVACTLVFAGEPPSSLAALPPFEGEREGGRAVLYPGVEHLTGDLTVERLLTVSAIGRVEVLGGTAADPSAVIRTNDFVRPLWRAGTLTLVTMPAADDRLVPFETRHPTPCCTTH
ncbi:hypothetical protein [Pseudosporangium ferrugineum]|uniref:Uncharacterized protein n=1 Tax=Pseudosporangium ferrugineum TaxID=439699 RepID=A0A2T0RRZ5_9ACTN|nr:hypothetical protein [Pseudosporangium ferrugineum]PRY23954.1 hypothetical protein CLV70_11487 [Pseudosporangium ferrugineum]